MRQLTRRQRTAALVLAALCLCFITLDLGGGSLQSAHAGMRGTLGALYRGTDGVVGPARRWVQGLPTAGSDQVEVRRLQHEVAQLHGQLADRAANTATTAALQKLRLAADRGAYSIAPARVIALGSGQGFDWTVTLDAGSTSGIRTGQTVTDGDGLVGRVLRADSSTSVVLLAADPRSGVGVRDLRTGQVGIASGSGPAGFQFVPLDPSADVRVGDRLATGPTGSTSYVAGLSVGTVTSVRTAGDGTTAAQVRPTTSPTSLDLVGVIMVGGSSASSASSAPSGTTRAPIDPGSSDTVAQR
jgi:rod shape-determining protein MreC